MKNLRLHKTFRTHYPTKTALAFDAFDISDFIDQKGVWLHWQRRLQPSMENKCSKNRARWTRVSDCLLGRIKSHINRPIKQLITDHLLIKNIINTNKIYWL